MIMRWIFFILFCTVCTQAQYGDAYHAPNNAEIYRQQSRDLQNTLNTIRTNMYSKSATPNYGNTGSSADDQKEALKMIEWMWDKKKYDEHWQKKLEAERAEQAERNASFRALYAQRYNEWYARLQSKGYYGLTAAEFANFHIVESGEMGEYQEFYIAGMTQKMYDAEQAYTLYLNTKTKSTLSEKMEQLYQARIMGSMLMPEINTLQQAAKDSTEVAQLEKLELKIWPYIFGGFRKKGIKYPRGLAEYSSTQYDKATSEQRQLMLLRFMELIDKYPKEGFLAAGNCRYGYNPMLLLFDDIKNDSNYTVEFKINLAEAVFATPINHTMEGGPKSSRTPDGQQMINALYGPILKWASEARKSYLATISEEDWDFIKKNSTISRSDFKAYIERYYGLDFFKFHFKNL